MGTGDLLGDLRERRITRTGILESVFRHGDGVSVAMPFAHQPGARLQAEAGSGPTRPVVRNIFASVLQLATRRLAEPAVFDFLKPVADPADQQVATDPWRLAVVKPPPFAAQFIKCRATEAIELVVAADSSTRP